MMASFSSGYNVRAGLLHAASTVSGSRRLGAGRPLSGPCFVQPLENMALRIINVRARVVVHVGPPSRLAASYVLPPKIRAMLPPATESGFTRVHVERFRRTWLYGQDIDVVIGPTTAVAYRAAGPRWDLRRPSSA